ncbi:MAG: MerR family transcriptional regulator [Sphingomicrobium sp.]
MATPDKSPGAFRTIGELSLELGVAQHILRYWETKFPQLKPLQRAGNRRYYRPADVDLARKIHQLLSQDGYTVRGVQKLLRTGTEGQAPAAATASAPTAAAPSAPGKAEAPQRGHGESGVDLFRLVALRNRLASALDN